MPDYTLNAETEKLLGRIVKMTNRPPAWVLAQAVHFAYTYDEEFESFIGVSFTKQASEDLRD